MIGKKIEDEKKVRTRWGIFHQLVDLLNKSTITIMIFKFIFHNQEGILNSNTMLLIISG
jgi:hypothetical protein